MAKNIKSIEDLQALYEALNDERKASLCDFADYLYSLGDLKTREIGEPLDIARPESETVVGAIKRLKATYPMVENMTVFSDASSLMTEHMISGRDVVEVIDEMEKLFENAYQSLLKENP